MPEYQCQNCGRSFEATYPVSNPCYCGGRVVEVSRR